MERSRINEAIKEAMTLLDDHNIYLPPFGYWTYGDWKDKEGVHHIKDLMLGWDVTDFGQGKFDTFGGVLFTLRNGISDRPDIGTPYAEKLIVLKEGQRLPLHYHKEKTEDIINRSGGLMGIKLYNCLETGQVDYKTRVQVLCDGREFAADPGETLYIERGASITLKPYQYHVFWAETGHGPCILGEVSSINDDRTDNYNAEPVSRFTTIEEDVPVAYPLCNELKELLG